MSPILSEFYICRINIVKSNIQIYKIVIYNNNNSKSINTYLLQFIN